MTTHSLHQPPTDKRRSFLLPEGHNSTTTTTTTTSTAAATQRSEVLLRYGYRNNICPSREVRAGLRCVALRLQCAVCGVQRRGVDRTVMVLLYGRPWQGSGAVHRLDGGENRPAVATSHDSKGKLSA